MPWTEPRALLQFPALSPLALYACLPPPVLVFKRPRAKDYLILLYSLTKLRGTTSVPSSTVLSFASRPTRRVLGKRGKERGEANVVRTNPRKGLERARKRNSTIFRDFFSSNGRPSYHILRHSICSKADPPPCVSMVYKGREKGEPVVRREQIFIHLVNFDISM